MSSLYSDYTVEQLREELGKLIEQSQKAQQLGEVSKYEILERKIQMVSSYMINPDEFKPGDIHRLKGDPGYTFKINFLEGVMAWGHRINLLGQEIEREEALPIALLDERIEVEGE
ncbi:MAG TPA: YfhH family protein [Pseudogracilibacillus sp.]|nr:YfhH family protein [Pseudogracilibacillus sp.]